MQLPFSIDQFLGVFRAYNDRIGIAPFLLLMLGVGVVCLAFSQYPWRHRVIAGALAFLFVWSGVVYHWVFFSRINPAAWLFGAVFIAQGVALIIAGVLRPNVRVDARGSTARVVGSLVVGYALILYPLLGWVFGHGYPSGPTFGAPCPTTIFFLGVMCWTVGRMSATLLVLPMLWVVIGSAAAIQLGIREDLGLVAAGILVLAELIRRWRLPKNVFFVRNSIFRTPPLPNSDRTHQPARLP